MAFIYGLFDPRKPLDYENCRYIGQTSTPLQDRLNRHVGRARYQRERSYHVNNWIWSLLGDDVRPIIVPFDEADESLIDDLERAWIAKGRELGWDLTNHQDGGKNNMLLPGAKEKVGAGHRGKKLTEEHKAKISESHIGISPSPETRAKISATLTGRVNGPMSDETKAKISAIHAGREFDDEWLKKMREAATKRWEDPEAREAYSELMTGVMADPEVRQRVSDGQTARFDRIREEAIANYSKNDTFIYPSLTIRMILGMRCDWTCIVCGDPLSLDIKYPDPNSFNISQIVRVPKRDPRTIANSVATHRKCRTQIPKSP